MNCPFTKLFANFLIDLLNLLSLAAVTGSNTTIFIPSASPPLLLSKSDYVKIEPRGAT